MSADTPHWFCHGGRVGSVRIRLGRRGTGIAARSAMTRRERGFRSIGWAGSERDEETELSDGVTRWPGKRTLTERFDRRSRARAAPVATSEAAGVAQPPFEPPLWVPLDGSAPVQCKGASAGPPPAPSMPAGSGSGEPLPEAVRARMERALGADFSNVRIHQDARAESLGALAYTQGAEIHFAPGQYRPDSQQGQELLGHELAHVVQQVQGRVRATAQAKGVAINDDAALEREADEMGASAARGEEGTMRRLDTSGLAGLGVAQLRPRIKDDDIALVEDPDHALFGLGTRYLKKDTAVEIWGRPIRDQVGMEWVYVEVLDGDAAGETGWVMSRWVDHGVAVVAVNAAEPAAMDVEEKPKPRKTKLEGAATTSGKRRATKGNRGEREEKEGEEKEKEQEQVRLSSRRFKGIPELQAVIDQEKVFRSGDRDPAIRIIQQLILDYIPFAGSPSSTATIPPLEVNGTFGPITMVYLEMLCEKTFEIASEREQLTKATLIALDDKMSVTTLKLDYADIARQINEKGPDRGVRKPTAEDAELIDSLISPAPRTRGEKKTGEDGHPPFIEDDYAREITERVESAIETKRAAAVALQERRRQPDGLFGWDLIQVVANQAKQSTDAVFGGYAQKPPITSGEDLEDMWDHMSGVDHLEKSGQDLIAQHRVEVLLDQSRQVAEVNRAHHVRADRPAEMKIRAKIIEILAQKHFRTLLLIHKATPAGHNQEHGKTHIQRDTGRSPAENRQRLWEHYTALVHEYIHSLAHEKWIEWHAGLMTGLGPQINEGATETLAQIVLSQTTQEHYAQVFGKYHEGQAPERKIIPRYTAAKETIDRVVAVLGIRSLFNAYFLGQVELLGKFGMAHM
jgi:uncharacterized protein DUF4157